MQCASPLAIISPLSQDTQAEGHFGYYSLLIESFFFSGRILRRNWDKSLKSFPPCYSQSPLLTDFTPPPEQKWFETGL